MALLKPAFLRAHPIQSGMVWGAFFGGLLLLLVWATRIVRISDAFLGMLIFCSIMGGLAWGYSMKAYHDREASR